MSVRRFLIAYLGFVVMLGVAAAATVQVLKQRHVAPVAPLAYQPAVPVEPGVTQPQQTAAAAPVDRLLMPRLAPHYSAPQQARAHASKVRHAGSMALAARSAPRWSPPPGPNPGPPGSPHYRFDPYAVGWPPPPSLVMMPRPVQSYPYYPYNPGYYGYYPRELYYRAF